MIHRIITVLLVLVLLGSLGMNVAAVEGSGSVSLQLQVDDLAVTNGAFTMYLAGIPVSDGYRITEDFGGGFVRREDAQSPHLAQWLSEGKGEQGRTLLLDADGNAVFRQLGEGLYLVVQTELTDGFYPIQPFLLTMPEGNRWEYPVNLVPLPRIAPSPATGQNEALYIGIGGMVLSAAGLLYCWKKRQYAEIFAR